MTRDESPSQERYKLTYGGASPTDDPYRALELTQLVADLKPVFSMALYTDEGLARIAEQLYARGIRSRLHAPVQTGDRVHFTWDPEQEGFLVTEPGVYELVMEATDVPAIEPFPTFPHAELPRMLHRLVKKASLQSPGNEGLRPGAAPARLREHVGAQILVRTDPDSVYTGEAWGKITPTSYGVAVTLDPNARIVPQLPMSEVPGHTQPVIAPGVPNPIPDRPLPDGVYNVIHFVAALKEQNVHREVVLMRPREASDYGVSIADLEATLAEIPDVAPRYPTIWAYEQACRTIRERDERIERALEKLDRWFTGKWAPSPDDVDAVRTALRLRMPRTEPATPEQLSEVTRALELADARDEHTVVPARDWISATRVLAAEVRRLRHIVDQQGDLADAVFTDPDTGLLVPCGTCSALEPPVQKPAVGRSGRGWPRCAVHLVEDALDDAGLEKDVQRCPSCSHLASAHYEDGSGCAVTIRDTFNEEDPHCPCTFDARSVHRE